MRVATKADFASLVAKLTALEQRQVPFAASVALNRTAEKMRAAIVLQMSRSFDRPTPYTLNALRIKRATKSRLYAEVSFKDESFKGSAADRYLGPQVQGGQRSVKRSERAMRSRGILPSDRLTMPGRGADLDGYGNIAPSQIVKLMSFLGAFEEQGYRANKTQAQRERAGKVTKKKLGERYFVIKRLGAKGGLAMGVWKETRFGVGRSIKPVLTFGREPAYKPRLPFYEIAGQVYDAEFSSAFGQSMSEALATAR